MAEDRAEKDADMARASQEETPAVEAVQPAETQALRRSAVQTFILMVTLCLAVFLAALDITIVATALPTISSYFDSTSGYTWVGSAYLLAAAVVAPSWAKFSDIWGRKPVLLVVISIFFLGSALCGAAVSLSMLLVGRALQGAAGGGLLSLASIIVGDLFSQRERGKYYGYIGMTWAIAFVLGPLVGGALTENVSWRWCFYINLPCSGFSFLVITWLLRLETPKTPFGKGIKIVDWIGTLLLIGGLLMLLLGLQLGGTFHPWRSATIICLLVFGVFTIALFFVYERYVAQYPLVPVHLYANVSNFAIVNVNLFHGIVLTASTYFLPLYCQAVLGASPTLSGALLLPFAFFMSAALVGSGNLIKRTGRYLECIRIGFFFLTLGNGLYYDLPNGRTWSKIILYQIIAGFGIGLNFQPPLIALQSNVPAQDNGAVTSSFGLVRNVASAIGVVIGSAVFGNGMNSQRDRLEASLGAEKALLFTGESSQANVPLIKSDIFDDSQRSVLQLAFWESIRTIWIVAVCFAGAALLASFLISGKKLNKTHETVKVGLAGEEERRQIMLAQRAANGKPKTAAAATAETEVVEAKV